MKFNKYIVTALIFQLFNLNMFSNQLQKTEQVEVKELKYKFKSGELNALSIEVADKDEKSVRSKFLDHLEGHFAFSLKNGKDIIVDNARLPEITNQLIDLQFTVNSLRNGGFELIVSFDFDEKMLSSNQKKEYGNAANYLLGFSRKASNEYLNALLKDEKEIAGKIKSKTLSIENDKKKLIKEVEGLKTEINSTQKKINKTEVDLNENIFSLSNHSQSSGREISRLGKEKQRVEKKREKLISNARKFDKVKTKKQKKINTIDMQLKKWKKREKRQQEKVDVLNNKISRYS